MEQVLQQLSKDHVLRSSVTKKVVTEVLPHMRFLHYDKAGGSSAPHIDLCRCVLFLCMGSIEFCVWTTFAQPQTHLHTPRNITNLSVTTEQRRMV